MKLTRVSGNGSTTLPRSWLEEIAPSVNRRDFLKAAGIGGLGVAATLAPSLAREIVVPG